MAVHSPGQRPGFQWHNILAPCKGKSTKASEFQHFCPFRAWWRLVDHNTQGAASLALGYGQQLGFQPARVSLPIVSYIGLPIVSYFGLPIVSYFGLPLGRR